MPRKDKILRSYLSMYTNRNRQKANSDVKYSVNFEYLMTGEGITENNGMKRKIIRLGTVLAYIFLLSSGAIVLSLYYCFIWTPYYFKGAQTNNSTTTKMRLANTLCR